MAAASGNHDTILMVGFVCSDLIFAAERYPEEDSLVRTEDFHKRRGGNASNSCSALSQVGAKCELLAPIATDKDGEFIVNDLERRGILFHHCHMYSGFVMPFTSIIQSLATGSRTIMQYRSGDWPENTVDDFCKVNLSDYSWIHFEGRGIPEVLKMIDVVKAWNSGGSKKYIPISVELEKCSESSKLLIPKGDVVFVAKEFVKFLGFEDALSALHGLAPQVKPGAVIIIPCGEHGAMARCGNGEIVHAKAYPPKSVVDTTGAGDTFIGATIFYLSQNKSVAESIDFGNKIAGAKCGTQGFDGINVSN